MNSTNAVRHLVIFAVGFMPRACMMSIGLLALAAYPVGADPKQTAFYAEVNECRPAPSFVCVELRVTENNAGDGAITLSYFVHDLNFAVIYIGQTHLLGLPPSMFTVSKDGRTADLIVPAGTAVKDFDGNDFVIPGDIAIRWRGGRDRTEFDITQKTFVGNDVSRFRRTTTHRPAVATGTLIGFPVDSRHGWPDCCREPGYIQTETTR